MSVTGTVAPVQLLFKFAKIGGTCKNALLFGRIIQIYKDIHDIHNCFENLKETQTCIMEKLL